MTDDFDPLRPPPGAPPWFVGDARSWALAESVAVFRHTTESPLGVIGIAQALSFATLGPLAWALSQTALPSSLGPLSPAEFLGAAAAISVAGLAGTRQAYGAARNRQNELRALARRAQAEALGRQLGLPEEEASATAQALSLIAYQKLALVDRSTTPEGLLTGASQRWTIDEAAACLLGSPFEPDSRAVAPPRSSAFGRLCHRFFCALGRRSAQGLGLMGDNLDPRMRAQALSEAILDQALPRRQPLREAELLRRDTQNESAPSMAETTPALPAKKLRI